MLVKHVKEYAPNPMNSYENSQTQDYEQQQELNRTAELTHF